MKLLLKGGTVVTGSGCCKADVLIEGEKIAKVGEGIEEAGADIVDVTDRILFPGFIDAHTHFDLEVCGTVTADDYDTGTKAAISGGTTMIIDFATQNKGETLGEAMDNWHKKADGRSYCDYGFHMAVCDWNERTSRDLEELVKGGVTSFKMYMTYDTMLDDKSIYQVLARLKELGGIAGVHCENKGIIEARAKELKTAGLTGPSCHPLSRPSAVEAEAVSRLLKIAALVDTPVIVVHLSSGAGYQEVKYARERGQEVYLETCPQYLLLNEDRYRLPGFEGAKYVIAPPLRKVEDSTRLWNAVRKDHIQTISTDHCSFTLAQKDAGRDDFTKIPGGMPGVETRPALIYTYGVRRQGLKLEQMCRLLAENPAKLYGVYPRKGCIAAGSDADIVVWNQDGKRILTAENQVANTDYQPYEGFEVQGFAERVYLRGRLAAQGGEVAEEKLGSYIARGRYQKLDV